MKYRDLQLLVNFYGRFALSFTSIGYYARRFFWQQTANDLAGKTVLITGASGGIGSSVVKDSISSGATVIAAARNQSKLNALRDTLEPNTKEQMVDAVYDLSLQSEIIKLVESCEARGSKIDVLVNSVGLMIHNLSITEEGFETSFATNLLNHYMLTTELLNRGLLADDAVVINVSSGGMYNAPLVLEGMNLQNAAYNGGVAYTLHKRSQVELTKYWRQQHKDSNMKFYVMHPGWVDTEGVKTALPTFRKIMQFILRDEAMGADTINWLAKQKPDQVGNEKIWFDRKPRKIHLSESTKKSKSNCDDLVEFLKSKLI